ncbi:MAG: protease complex subunit PrcB family protein [Stagnimonas sp.]|nr:protease complex subunit PrcB family protein [Stagnimonas sp.]
MSGLLGRAGLLLAVAGLGACAQVVPVAEGVAQLPRKAVEGTAGFFGFIFSRPELSVEVVEVSRLQHCQSSGREATLEVLANPIALAAWEQARGLKLTPASGELPVGLYAVAEMGERNTGGYALVISRQGAVKDDTLYLKATFLSPSVSGMASQALTSPCTLVALPTRSDFHRAVLVDQSDRERARWAPLSP